MNMLGIVSPPLVLRLQRLHVFGDGVDVQLLHRYFGGVDDLVGRPDQGGLPLFGHANDALQQVVDVIVDAQGVGLYGLGQLAVADNVGVGHDGAGEVAGAQSVDRVGVPYAAAVEAGGPQ